MAHGATLDAPASTAGMVPNAGGACGAGQARRRVLCQIVVLLRQIAITNDSNPF